MVYTFNRALLSSRKCDYIKSLSDNNVFYICSAGVFVADADVMKSVSVTEGDSVTLNTDITEVQRDDHILWMFGPKETRIAELYKQSIDMFSR